MHSAGIHGKPSVFSFRQRHPAPGTIRSCANDAREPRNHDPHFPLVFRGNARRPRCTFMPAASKLPFHVYFFCHLLGGLLIGLVLYALKRDRLLVAAAVIGSVLPDLIDKPLGFLITGTVGYGRIYAHTLLFFLVLLLAGIIVWRMCSPRACHLVGATAAGVLSHQLLDAMWLEPSTWYWPLLGPFPPPETDIPLLSYLLGNILQPAEWLFAAACFFLAAGLAGLHGRWQRIAPALSLVLAFFAMWVFLCALTGSWCPVTGWDDRWDNAIVASMLLLGAAGVDRAGGGMSRIATPHAER